MEEISIGEFARKSRLSLKALRLYDERGLLVPLRVDQASGYRYYGTAQLDQARLIVMLRQLQLPLAAIKELLACDPADAATRITEHWRDAEAAHDARRDLADYLVSRLSGRRLVMYEVATREMPGRSLLCVKRSVDEQGAWAFGKEFIAILRERPLPRIEGQEGAFFCIFWGQVSADSDGPVEWCRRIGRRSFRCQLARAEPQRSTSSSPSSHSAPGRMSRAWRMSVIPLSPQTSACASLITPVRPLRPSATSPSRSRSPMIEAHGLVERYGATTAVNDLSFTKRSRSSGR